MAELLDRIGWAPLGGYIVGVGLLIAALLSGDTAFLWAGVFVVLVSLARPHHTPPATRHDDVHAARRAELRNYTHDSARGTACHEIDHLMGLGHVWSTTSGGIDNIGSKATCIGMGSDNGPRIDDTSALDDVYSGVVP